MNRQGRWTNRDGVKGECAMEEQERKTSVSDHYREHTDPRVESTDRRQAR
jgi:hypothetical protein